jgi:hypothetical protein
MPARGSCRSFSGADLPMDTSRRNLLPDSSALYVSARALLHRCRARVCRGSAAGKNATGISAGCELTLNTLFPSFLSIEFPIFPAQIRTGSRQVPILLWQRAAPGGHGLMQAQFNPLTNTPPCPAIRPPLSTLSKYHFQKSKSLPHITERYDTQKGGRVPGACHFQNYLTPCCSRKPAT